MGGSMKPATQRSGPGHADRGGRGALANQHAHPTEFTRHDKTGFVGDIVTREQRLASFKGGHAHERGNRPPLVDAGRLDLHDHFSGQAFQPIHVVQGVGHHRAHLRLEFRGLSIVNGDCHGFPLDA